jgi:hypothetical protein
MDISKHVLEDAKKDKFRPTLLRAHIIPWELEASGLQQISIFGNIILVIFYAAFRVLANAVA